MTVSPTARRECIRGDTCDTLPPRQRRSRASMVRFCISVANGEGHPLKVPAGLASRCVTMFCMSADDYAVSGNCRCHRDRGCPIHREEPATSHPPAARREPAEVPCGYDHDGKCFCARGFDFGDDDDDGCGFGEAFMGFLIARISIVAPTILFTGSRGNIVSFHWKHCRNLAVFPKPRDAIARIIICAMNVFITIAIMGTYAYFYDFTGCNPALFTFPFVVFVVGVNTNLCRRREEGLETVGPTVPKLSVKVHAHGSAGSVLQIIHNGQALQVTVPPGISAGQSFVVNQPGWRALQSMGCPPVARLAVGGTVI